MSELKRHRKKQKRRKSRHLLAGSSAFYAGVFSCIAAAIVVSALLSVYFPTAAKPEKEKPKAVEVSAEPSTSKKPASITYTAAGDIILHKPFLESPVYLDSQDGTYDYTSIFTYCKDLLSEADYTSVTFEGSLVDGSNGYSGYPMFQGPDALADALAASGIDMVNLASNHVYDAAEEGFLRTLDVIKQKNLIPCGVRSSEEENRYTIQDIGGIKVGIISYVYETTEAGGAPSINGIPLSDSASALINSFDYNDLDSFYTELQDSLEAIEKDGAEYTIAYMHWGIEYQTQQSQQQEEIAQKLCDLGIDVLIGSHPHVIQPVDLLTSTNGEHQMVCAYAIGNFLSNQQKEYMQAEMPTGETEDGYVLSLSIDRDKKGNISLTDAVFTPTWVYRFDDVGAQFYILPVNDPAALETSTGISGISAEAQESASRTGAIINEGVEKVRAALPIRS